MSNQQLHNRFHEDQVKTILESYLSKEITSKQAGEGSHGKNAEKAPNES